MEYKIEEFKEEHLLLKESFFDTLKSLSDVLVLDIEETQKLLQKINNQWWNIFVAVSDEHGIIWTITLLIEQKFIKWWAIAGHIEDVVTRKGFTGQGVAKKLIERVIKEAKEKWCYKIILDCNSQLTPFYEKFWFKKEWIFMRSYLK